MRKFDTIKVKTKFLLMILIVGVCVFILSFIGVTFLKNSNQQYYTSINNNKVLVEQGLKSISTLIDFRTVVLNLASYNSSLFKKDFDTSKAELKSAYDSAKNALKEYESIIEQNPDNKNKDLKKELEIINKLHRLTDEYYNEYLNHINMHQQGVFDGIDGEQKHTEHSKLTQSIEEKIFGKIGEVGFVYELPNTSFRDMVDGLSGVYESANTKTIILLVIAVIIVLLLIIFSSILSVSIVKPMDNIILAANRVVHGDLNINIRTTSTNELGNLSNSIDMMSNTIISIIDDINELSNELEKGNLSYRINCEKYEGAFKQATNAINNSISGIINDTNYIIGTIDEIGNGNFEQDIKVLDGDKIIATNGLKSVQNELKHISKEIQDLINAVKEGNLEYKIDTKNYKGAWKDTTIGLNEFVESVVIPIKETQNALNQFSNGNFSHRITNEYKGEFNNIKNTVNFTAQTIGSYINEISDILTKMSKKDFDISIDREYLGDFETIKKSVMLIVKNLNILTKDIISSAEQVSAGAKQISETSISLAEGATEQAETVEKLNSNIKLIYEQTTLNTQASNKANELALKTKENANAGTEQMDKMLLAMEEINIASSSISNIIKVIDDIAFQTNILALNAAVEAARAGEHGKGFAVVAEEVRSLAARSQQAAKETTTLIESSVSKVEEGYKIANITAEELQRIVEEIEEISHLVNQSTLSSESQEQAINAIVDSISQISNVTQNNTATSEESAAAAQELASQSEVFYSSVADFKLKENLYSNEDIY